MRHNENVGSPMLVRLPSDGYEDTGEGGLAFFLLVYKKDGRQTCLAGDIFFPLQNCQIKPKRNLGDIDFSSLWQYSQYIDAGLLIGSTGLSLWSDFKGEYFCPTVDDLTPEGKRLYHTLKRLYGEVTIVTLLDT